MRCKPTINDKPVPLATTVTVVATTALACLKVEVRKSFRLGLWLESESILVMALKVLTDKEVQGQGRVCVLVCACVFQTSMI